MAARRVSRGNCWLGALASTLAIIVCGAAPTWAASLPPSTSSLPGSSFQGADGDQDDSAPLVDWQGSRAAGAVRHSPDPNDHDSAFTGGSEEDRPGEWDLTSEAGGVTPAKSNILDAWSVVDQPGSATFVYLGFTRESTGGTTYLAFELNRDSRLWDNGHAWIPCRRTGDVLVSYQASGNDVVVVIQRWITTATDADTGCATRGRLDAFTRLTPNVDAQGAINSGAITSRLPGTYAPGDSIPAERFGEAALNLATLLDQAFDDPCLAYRSIWMHTRSSTSESSNMQDYVAPRRLDVRTCSASGTKFFDSNANGRRDSGERGIPRFLIWADYDDDGVHDSDEPFSVSDNRGRYVIFDIRGTYTLRETLLTRRSPAIATDWVCSYPNATTPGGTATAPGGRFGCAWGPIDSAAVPNARGRDFGNWFPARLTLEKVIEPATDPGRFDLLVNGSVALAAAGDGDSVTLSVPPGSYDVAERATASTDAAAYRSTVECRRTASRGGGRRSGPVWENLELQAGQRASCTFRNIRPGSPAIAIRKVGPDTATAGDTLNYRLFVTNPGDVAFPASAVVVRDGHCDDPPERVSKEDGSGPDSSPRTLDPGDTRTYRCSRATAAGAGCEPALLDNTGVATGTAEGVTVDDEDSISTILLCPDGPSPSPEPLPHTDPDEPGPVAPPGPTPPNAGAAGVAGVLFRNATRGCIGTRVPRIPFRGTRISRIRVFITGREDRRLTVRALQRRVRPRVRLAPGTYRVTVRVIFQRGAATPAVTLTRRVAICGAAPPRFTG
jgi:hypothetical protein